MENQTPPDSSSESPRRRPQPSAKDKVMDMLARRDHSVKELRQKLSRKYSSTEVEDAIDWAQVQGWLPEAPALSQKVASSLHRKHKGIHFINQYLREKGLPSVERDSELELEKARYLVENKSSKKELAKEKLARFLAARGFDSETIRKVMYEKR